MFTPLFVAHRFLSSQTLQTPQNNKKINKKNLAKKKMSNTNNKLIMRKRGLDFDDYDYDFDEDEQTSCYTDDRPAAQQQQQQKLKKPRRKGITEIATSLALLNEQEKCDDEESAKSVLEERQFFEAGRKEKTQLMMKYKSDVETRYADSNFQDLAFLEKSRLNTATGVLTAVAVQGVVSFNSSERKKVAAVAAAASNTNTNNSKSDKTGGGGGGGAAAAAGSQRRLWVKARSKAWWDECNSPDYPEEDFKKAFRMSKRTFEAMCDELNSFVAKENTTLRDAIPVKQRVAVCVWRLATGEPLRMVSKRFGLGISTCHKLVLEVCSAIRTVLMPKYLQWPDDESLKETKDEFGSVSGIPSIVGSMYTTHIPIIAPKISVAAYFNRRHTERNQKNSYSITVQGVVNPKGVFTDVCIGWPGSMSDDQVLEKSALFQRANGGLLKGVWIVGSSGFPLLDWVMVPYTQQNLTWTQHAFNEKIGEVQRVSKEAFARLKGRWTCLQKRTEVKLQDLPVVLGACCVLHNICELSSEEIDPKLMIDLVDDEMLPEIPLRSVTSLKARDSIAHNLLHHGLAGTSFL